MLVELVIAGEHRPSADLLLDRFSAAEGLTLFTAAHGLVEAISALRRLSRAGQLPVDDATAAVGWLAKLDIVLDASGPRLASIWALRDRMSAYYAAYAACAVAIDGPLVSTDRRLLDACRQAGIAAVHLDEMR